jgi:glutamyl-Q tRNA(Asp) synthetase
MYSGRFAPSPSGPLHLGSLLAAVASWLDARANQGTWMVRIEDIDPPREVEGSDRLILQSLQAHGLSWDHAVEYQSSRLELYREHLQQLRQLGLAYPCSCSRSDIAEMGGFYDGRCRQKTTIPERGFAWRFKMPGTVEWQDAFAGPQKADSPKETADPVIWRRDGLVAYHLAAAVDDTTMQISHVVRGADLLSSTTAQLALIDALDKPRSEYGHIPVLNGANDQKLSKQNHAEPLDDSAPERNLSQVLALLGQRLPAELVAAPVHQQLDWAIDGWNRNSVPAVQAIRL